MLISTWKTLPLNEVVEILDSRRVPVNSEERAKRGGTVPYYGATGQVGLIDDYIFNEELVLLGEDGAPFLDSGKPKAYLIRGRSWVNNHAHVLRGRPGLLNSFLLYQLNNLDYRPYVSGTTRLKLPQGPMRRIPLLVPEESEQHRIVAEIEKQFTRLEAGGAALRRVQANLKRYRAAVLKAACEGKLVPTEAERARFQRPTKNSQPAFESGEALLSRILTERRKNWTGRGKYKEPVVSDTANLPSLPEGWTWATIEQLTNLVATGATPYRGKSVYWAGGTIPWVTSGALNYKAVDRAHEFITPLAIEETNAKVFPAGTLLVALYGEGKTRGMVSELRIDAATNQACAALLFSRTNASVRSFVKIFLEKNYEDVRLLSSGGVQPNLSLSIIKNTKMPVPPLVEQTRIVAEVERRLSVVEELESVVSANLQRSIRLRQSILQKAFTGELV